MIDGTQGAAAPAPEVSAARPQSGRFSLLDQIHVSLLWFALFANWLTVVPVIIPDQVATILGADAASKEGISGTILAAGAVVALGHGAVGGRVVRPGTARGDGVGPS